MGGSSWSDAAYYDRTATRASTGAPTFAHTAAVRAGTVAAKCHDLLNPYGVKFRESRDSDAHPNSNPVAVILDETGSMGSVIGAIQKSLPALMGLLVRKNYLTDPQVLFSAIGDVPNGEAAPLQVGQFESGLEMEDDMSRIFIERNGGGTMHESYQNAAYFLARHTATDAWDKRGKKGYLFILGDELNYAEVDRQEIKKLVGDDLQTNISARDIYKELAEKWNVFFILPKGANNGGNVQVISHWKELVGGENVLELADASATAELIATQIGMCEGTTDADGAVKDMTDLGVSDATALVVAGSVSRAYTGGTLAKASPGTLAPSTKTSGAKRL